MEHRDARTLKAEAQEELRRQAIRMIQQGNTQQVVADQLEVSRRSRRYMVEALHHRRMDRLEKEEARAQTRRECST